VRCTVREALLTCASTAVRLPENARFQEAPVHSVLQCELQCVLQCMLQCVLQCVLHCVLQCDTSGEALLKRVSTAVRSPENARFRVRPVDSALQCLLQ